MVVESAAGPPLIRDHYSGMTICRVRWLGSRSASCILLVLLAVFRSRKRLDDMNLGWLPTANPLQKKFYWCPIASTLFKSPSLARLYGERGKGILNFPRLQLDF